MIEGKSVTAVIFAYNEEKYISDTLRSILEQKEVDKIIFVDDQSTDNTIKIVKDFNSDLEIEVHTNKNKGKANAFAYGLSKVNTDLFFVCHGDDVLLPGFVKKLYAYLLEKSIDFCYANSTMCNENMVPIGIPIVQEVYTDLEILNRNAIGGYIFGYSEIIRNILPFPPDLKFEDWFTNIKLACYYNRLYVQPTPTFLYIRHSNSDSIRLNKTLPERSYNLIARVLNENLITLSTKQKDELTLTKERYYFLAQSMSYLFYTDNYCSSIRRLLGSQHLSLYVKSLILFKKIFRLNISTMLKIDSYLIKVKMR
jgi:glycosyltransferase involved in cell wall biosynthesis